MTEQRNPKLSLAFESVLTLFRSEAAMSEAENFFFGYLPMPVCPNLVQKKLKGLMAKTLTDTFFLLKQFNWGKIPQAQHKNW